MLPVDIWTDTAHVLYVYVGLAQARSNDNVVKLVYNLIQLICMGVELKHSRSPTISQLCTAHITLIIRACFSPASRRVMTPFSNQFRVLY